MYCKFCGQQIADDSVFCGFCGQRVDEAVQQPVQAALPEPVRLDKADASGEQGRRSDWTASEMQREEQADETAGKSGRLPWFWTLLVVIVVGLLAFAIFSQGSGIVLPIGTKEDCIKQLDESLAEMETLLSDSGMECELTGNDHTWKQEGCRFHYNGPIKVSLYGIETTAQFDADFVVTKESVKLIAVKLDGISFYQYIDGSELLYPFLEDDDAVDAYFWKITKDGTIDGEKIIFPDQNFFTKDWPLKEVYENLEIGMSYNRVCATLGQEGVKQATLMSGTEVYRWGTESKYAELQFRSGRLVSKRLDGFYS